MNQRTRSALWPAPWWRVVATLLLAYAAARLCVWWGTPIPWMIGPLVATAACSLLGAPVASAVPLRNGGQWVIGTALGLYFTPAVGARVVQLWWAVALGVLWALVLGWGFGAWLYRRHHGQVPGMDTAQWRSTAFFAGAIGAASEMTLMAERHGARTDLVAAAHSLRVLLVTLAIPFGMQAWGVHDLLPEVATEPVTRDVYLPGLALLGLISLAVVLLMRRLGGANPWFLGAWLAAAVLTVSGVRLSAIPTGLSNAAQLVIGVSLGVRFTPDFVRAAPRWLASVALATMGMLAAALAFAWGLARLSDLPLATLVLGTAPGGIAEMSITAKVLQLGAPMVTAFQVCRLLAVLVLTEPLYRWWVRRQPVPVAS
jgi:membrane AbrB-like protein